MERTLATMESAKPYYTLETGVPLPRNDTVDQLSTGAGGGFVLLTSTQLIENLAHFSRERIPERVVHAKGAAAKGYYEVTDDVSDLTDADFLNGMGKKCEVLMRIPTTGPEKGSADTVRDFRGFAVKFKTNEGNNDWVFNNQVCSSSTSLTLSTIDYLSACLLCSRPRQISFRESKPQETSRHKLSECGHVLGLSHQ